MSGVDLKKLMMKRQDFPIEKYRLDIKNLRPQKIKVFEMNYWNFLPPLHPDLAKNDLPLDPEIAVPLVKEALDYTLLDLNPKEISDDTYQHFWFRDTDYSDTKKEADNAELRYNYDRERQYIMVYDIPLFISDNYKDLAKICIEPRELSPGSGDEQIIVQGAGFFNVPKIFSEEMLNEYNLKIQKREVPFEPEKMEVFSPYSWYHHNVRTRDSILYKNLIITMNNWAVARKYGASE